jgi:hypothetical protein
METKNLARVPEHTEDAVKERADDVIHRSTRRRATEAVALDARALRTNESGPRITNE